MLIRNAVLATVLVFGLAGAVEAQVDVDFESVPLGTTLDGLDYGGVMFQFLLDGASSSDAMVTGFFACTDAVCGRVAQGTLPSGSSGSVRLTFMTPQDQVKFGLAAGRSLPTSATLTLFDGDGVALGMQTLALSTPSILDPNGTPIAYEGIFMGGGAVIGAISIDMSAFVDLGAPGPFVVPFALDNIEGRAPVVGVPEPTTWMLLMSGLLGLGIVVWRRRGDAVMA